MLTRTTTALAPVRAELLRRAETEADTVLAAAEADARRTTEDAEARARDILDHARAQGRADGASQRAAELTRVRRDLRTADLEVRRQAYEHLRDEAVEAVRRLRDAPDYPELLERLTTRARELLGPDAVVTEHPAGGIVAETATRRLDLTLATVAVRAFERVAADVERLWTT
ncbi:vacuolar-type H+-ATPase subunit E/Vma4 [Amycolatopsis lexingtonensis]|uniref:Vacuolar-type H+-ATPase subunit E/Vma4 n=1 Tax=Amycolatopsis lexingtonensis TaxID=218822 RepID=A0ABR9HSX3_9PSEU|nr:V-type ATP synthase subunit E [Amycolatopsis lexingtonensis]MBE1494018.1 vacuolar-type H+-ATPase subunit E/Vma4 [Amycolatopsis lexingtonensis]